MDERKTNRLESGRRIHNLAGFIAYHISFSLVSLLYFLIFAPFLTLFNYVLLLLLFHLSNFSLYSDSHKQLMYIISPLSLSSLLTFAFQNCALHTLGYPSGDLTSVRFLICVYKYIAIYIPYIHTYIHTSGANGVIDPCVFVSFFIHSKLLLVDFD